MAGYVARRILLAFPVLAAVLTIAFFATVTAPGDPLAALLPDNATPEQVEQAAREFGLDRPLHERWLRFMARTLEGDLGRSLRTRQPVVEDLQKSVAATIELAAVAFVVAASAGVAIGIITAVRAGQLTDHALSILSLGGIAAPIFWTGLIAQLFFYGQLGWLPAGGRVDDFVLIQYPFEEVTRFYLVDTLLAGNLAAFGDVAKHLLLPAAVLAYRSLATVVRVTRAVMIETINAQYVKTAQAFGIPPRRIVLRHAFPNALPPIMTVLGLAFGEMLAGSVLVETVFNWPGLGLYTTRSILALDYPGVVGASLVITIAYVAANLVVDVLYPLADPRLRPR